MNNPRSDGQLPADLVAIHAALDDLAARERDAATPTLEDRVFIATRASLARSSQVAPDIVVRRISLGGLRIAAAVALLGALGAVWLARSTPATSSPAKVLAIDTLEDDVEFLLAMRTIDDFNPSGDSLDAIFLDTSSLDTKPTNPLDEGGL